MGRRPRKKTSALKHTRKLSKRMQKSATRGTSGKDKPTRCGRCHRHTMMLDGRAPDGRPRYGCAYCGHHETRGRS